MDNHTSTRKSRIRLLIALPSHERTYSVRAEHNQVSCAVLRCAVS